MNAPGNRPPVTDVMRQAAQAKRGGWIYVIDPAFDPNGEVPPEGIVGAYPVDDASNIVEDGFAPNPRYRPTPRALDLPEPTDAVDDLLQRTATGWAAESALLDALAGSELWLLAGPEGEVFITAGDDGRRTLWLFTDPAHAERSAPGRPLQRLGANAVVSAVPAGVDLEVNPGSATSVRIPQADLAGAVRREP
jgi:type III secretion system (T3SS) SseB-like protein